MRVPKDRGKASIVPLFNKEIADHFAWHQCQENWWKGWYRKQSVYN